MPSAREQELAKLHEQQERERARELVAVRKRLAPVFVNEAGQARLRAITDEEWEAAVQAGEPEQGVSPEVGGAA